MEEANRLRQEERERKQREEKEWCDNLVKEIMNEYGFNKAVAEAVVQKGWEDGHSYGYSEVRNCSQIAAEFAETILKSVELVSR